MIRYLLPSILSFCSVVSEAQSFMKTYHPDNPLYPIEVRDLKLTSDGNYIAGFDLRDNDSLGYPRAGFMKLDAFGDVIWSLMLDIPNCSASCSYEVAEKFNGNYYLYGLALNDSLSGSDSLSIVMDPYLCEIDPNGNLLYYRYYESPANFGAYSVNSLEILPSDSIAMLVSVNNYVEVIKTDPNGHVDWATRTYNNINLYGKNPGFDFLYLSDSTYLVVCKSQEDLTFFKLDKYGQIMWFRWYSLANYCHIKSLLQTDNGDIYGIGYATDQGVPYTVHVLLLKIDPINGDISMAKSFPAIGFNALTMAELYEHNNSLVISLCGPTFNSFFEEQVIIRTDYQGNFIEGIQSDNVILNYNTIDKFNDTTHALSGNMYYYNYDGFIQISHHPVEACGFYDIPGVLTDDFTDFYDTTHTYYVDSVPNYYSPNVTTFPVIIEDSLICENVSLPEEDQIQPEIYPNPSTGLLNIELNQTQSSTVKVQVIDLQGRVLLNQERSTGNFQLYLGDFSKGFYLIRIGLNDNWFSQKIILE